MLNPDGVIVGNYRCSLAGRDLNRNYRHPRRDNFPTIFAVKAMVEELAQKQEVGVVEAFAVTVVKLVVNGVEVVMRWCSRGSRRHGGDC